MKVYLSPPTVGEREIAAATEALQSGWLAPAGPALLAFEKALSRVYTPKPENACLAVSSGTAALHLGFECAKKLGLKHSNSVWVSTMTFSAALFAMDYAGLKPVLLDIHLSDFNQDVSALIAKLNACHEADLPSVILLTFLYGCPSKGLNELYLICKRLGVFLLVDAAEALGAFVDNEVLFLNCDAFVLSFNGNKIISTGGGGALISQHSEWLGIAKFLSLQSRSDDVLSYFHTEIGYNYRLSNVSAAIGCAQLSQLDEKIAKRRAIFDRYVASLSPLGFIFQSFPDGVHSNYWLSTVLLPCPKAEALGKFLWQEGIECRRFWTPMHLQPFLKGLFDASLFPNANFAYERGICLPSGDGLSEELQAWIVSKIEEFLGRG